MNCPSMSSTRAKGRPCCCCTASQTLGVMAAADPRVVEAGDQVIASCLRGFEESTAPSASMPTACSYWSATCSPCERARRRPVLRPAHPDATAACGVPVLGMCPTALTAAARPNARLRRLLAVLAAAFTLSRRSAPRRTSISAQVGTRQTPAHRCASDTAGPSFALGRSLAVHPVGMEHE